MIGRRHKRHQVEFDEILLDASNLPSFNQGRMEGRRELPIPPRSIFAIGVIFLLITFGFTGKLFALQVLEGESYRERSEANRLDEGLIVAERGVIYDRNGEMLAWNEQDYNDKEEFPLRAYTDRHGLGQLTGYISYPQKDTKGVYYRTAYIGRTGVESAFESTLQGDNGRVLVEVDALGEVISSHAVEVPKPGEPLELSIDAALSEAMYDIIETAVADAGFRSGAAAIMDVRTGEILAMTSFPSYDPEVMADGDDVALINSYNEDGRFPFLNKVVGGAYTPGSIVKPFLAYAALAEDIISPNKRVTSNGSMLVPNPYDPDNPTRFADWRRQGSMTMREAIAFSSNVYFYIIGGGLTQSAASIQPELGGVQEGLGITRINEYMHRFGFGEKTGIALSGEQAGTVPNPEWKQEVFDDDWRLGDTYNTSIGQFGFQTTPLQMLRAYAALANGGTLLTPHIEKGKQSEAVDLLLEEDALRVIHEGMRMTVNYDRGTARSLERSDIAIAAKSGTAEVGVDNAFVNSWVAGFFPYEEPRYSFILLMDRAPRSNALGATRVMGDIVAWMSEHTPEYLNLPPKTDTTD
ncbi:MAG: penicillin-binding transpeptidase domain-containing protein [Candidatus Paceibacterota bacterium]